MCTHRIKDTLGIVHNLRLRIIPEFKLFRLIVLPLAHVSLDLLNIILCMLNLKKTNMRSSLVKLINAAVSLTITPNLIIGGKGRVILIGQPKNIAAEESRMPSSNNSKQRCSLTFLRLPIDINLL